MATGAGPHRIRIPIRDVSAVHRRPARLREGMVSATQVLALLTALLAGIAAAFGVFWQGTGGLETIASVRGETVDLYREGIYRYDTVFKGAANRGADVVTLAIAVPLLLVTLARWRAGSVRAQLLMLGTLVWFLYVAVSLAFGTAYNDLFLAYVAMFSASLFAVVLAFRSIDPQALANHLSPDMPRRVPGWFMLVSGVVTFGIWLQPLVGALIADEAPDLLDSSTTMVTDALDIGVIVPVTILAGTLILQRRALGYVLAFSLLVLEALLAPMIVMQTVYQLDAGVDLSTVAAIGAIAGFTAIAVAAIWVIVLLLRHISDAPRADSTEPAS